jgi:GAF domain-containing protein
MADQSPQAREERPASPALLRALSAHPELAADLVQALHTPVHQAADLIDLMGRASREAVRLLDGVHWAGVTAQFAGEDPFTAAHTDELVLIVDEYQYAEHGGPCLQAVATDRTVRATLEEVEVTWPHLAAGARAAGVHSFLAVPLRVQDRPVGSLNLYSAQHGALSDVDPDLLAVLTEYLSRGLAGYAEQQPARIGDSLRDALTGRAVIEQAIGVLMASRHLRVAEARDLLRLRAHEANLSIRIEAQRIVEGQLPPPD